MPLKPLRGKKPSEKKTNFSDRDTGKSYNACISTLPTRLSMQGHGLARCTRCAPCAPCARCARLGCCPEGRVFEHLSLFGSLSSVVPIEVVRPRRAALEGLQGTNRGLQEIVTYEGLKAKGKAQRAASRTAPGIGKRRPDWGKHALAAYTWTSTNRGPQKAWLHHIGQAEDPSCPCGHPTQDGDHLVFDCPHLLVQR